jgi:hypothetical protein
MVTEFRQAVAEAQAQAQANVPSGGYGSLFGEDGPTQA